VLVIPRGKEGEPPDADAAKTVYSLREGGGTVSLNTMLQVELDRDATTPKKRVRRKSADKTSVPTEEEQKRTDLLIHAIPTEVLAPYTALVGGIVATIDPGENDQAFLRWTIYVVGLAAIALYLGVSYARQRAQDSKRKFPWAGTLAAIAAFAAWGLVMPGSPLSLEVSGDALTRWTLIITVGGAFLVGLMTQSLKQPAKRKTRR
jgi:uncharacterized membrane-anchored protein